jgi:hypothetical protein
MRLCIARFPKEADNSNWLIASDNLRSEEETAALPNIALG